MQKGIRIFLAFGVLVAGIAGAMAFRRTPSASDPAPIGSDRPLVLLDPEAVAHVEPRPVSRPADPPPVARQSDRSDTRRSTNRRPAGNPPTPTAPPPLAHSYPEPPLPIDRHGPRPSSPTGAKRNSSREPVRIHEIVDGDTLVALADYYLDDPDRYLDIYRANLLVLKHPELLPIGAKLTIPPRVPHESPNADLPSSFRLLVPIAPPASASRLR